LKNDLRAFALMLLVCLIAVPVMGFAQDAAETGGAAHEARLRPAASLLPRVLSARDAALYREVFVLTGQGQWDSVDALIAELGNDLLIGHVLAQRYLHPTAYASRPEELAMWLARYADHPESGQIRELVEEKREAERRALLAARRAAERERLAQARAAKAGRKALGNRTAGAVTTDGTPRSKRRTGKGRSVTAEFDFPGFDEVEHLALAAPAPRSIPWQPGGGHPFARSSLDAGAGIARVAWDGTEARTRGSWNDALGAWQVGDYPLAAQLFEAVAERGTARTWTTSAAAFWAARAHFYARQPERVNPLLMRAAEHPRTFYGLLARRILGLPMEFRWQPDQADAAAVIEIAGTRPGQRTLALIQIGQLPLAEAELEGACCGRRSAHTHGAMVVAEQAGLARLAVRLAGELYPNGGGLDAASYPVPHWHPDGGFTTDRALVYALARQESKFDPRAVSPAGARGLMQVMPATANLVGRVSGEWSPGTIRLHDPSVNLAVGQRYIEMLLGEAHVGNDLFRLTAAWNGGPNNVRKWENGVAATDDPLLFIETIPYGETRDFIERVLANYWIYRNRFGQPAPSLDALATGAWPTYVEFDHALAQAPRTYAN
jgi:hypothetical protein